MTTDEKFAVSNIGNDAGVPTLLIEATQEDVEPAATWFGAATDVGRKRANNEDKFLCDAGEKLFIVADGMGGHAAGEQASAIVIESLHRQLARAPVATDLSSPVGSVLERALIQANQDVIEQSTAHTEWHGMGSTAVVALFKNSALHVANVGDSRAYLISEGRYQIVSRDHSVAALLCEQGHISAGDIRTHPRRNQLTMCLGGEPQIDPEYSSHPLQRNDRILLCSDGLWEMLTDREIVRLVSSHPVPQEAVVALIDAANEAGGKDNITAIVIAVGDAILCH